MVEDHLSKTVTRRELSQVHLHETWWWVKLNPMIECVAYADDLLILVEGNVDMIEYSFSWSGGSPTCYGLQDQEVVALLQTDLVSRDFILQTLCNSRG